MTPTAGRGHIAQGGGRDERAADFCVEGVLDRFGQITPKSLIGVDGYTFQGTVHDMGQPAGEYDPPGCPRNDDRHAGQLTACGPLPRQPSDGSTIDLSSGLESLQQVLKPGS